MKLQEIIQMLRNEKVILKKNLKKEKDFYFSLSFKEYISELFFPYGKNKFITFLRFLILYPVFRFIYESIFFILQLIFNYYYIFVERFFEVWRRINFILFGEGLIYKMNFKIIKFFRYIFLFTFFVNINKQLKKKRITLRVYLIEKIADVFIYILRRRLKFRYVLYPVFKLIEIFFVFLFMIACVFACFIDYLIIPLINVTYHVVFLRFWLAVRYYGYLIKFNNSGPYYLNDVALFQMSTMLQYHGFVAPVCNDKVVWLQAKIAYRKYRKKYLSSELIPDKVDNDAMNIYIYLKELLKDTRYQRKYFGFFDFIRVMYPHNLMVDTYFFVKNFILGFVFIVYIILSPFIYFFIFCLLVHYACHLMNHQYTLWFRDINVYLYVKKRRQLRYEMIKRKIKKIYHFFYFKFNFLFSLVKKMIKKIFLFLKKIYEKIFR
jgi:hypothetical protein